MTDFEDKSSQGLDSVGSAENAPGLAELLAAIDHLQDNGLIDQAQAHLLKDCVPAQYEQSGYILKHFGAHLTIGAIFAFDLVPLPLGTIGRVGWVCSARVAETLRGNSEKARMHSLQVFLVSAIPWIGYVAYLIPLRKHHGELAYVLTNSSWLKRTGRSFEEAIANRSRPLQRMCRALVPLPWG